MVEDILGRMGERRKAELFKFVDWTKIRAVFLVVILTEGEPHILLDHSEIPVITYDILRTRLRTCDFSAPKRFWSACIERNWLQGKLPEAKTAFISIPVGEITYRLPTLQI